MSNIKTKRGEEVDEAAGVDRAKARRTGEREEIDEKAEEGSAECFECRPEWDVPPPKQFEGPQKYWGGRASGRARVTAPSNNYIEQPKHRYLEVQGKYLG